MVKLKNERERTTLTLTRATQTKLRQLASQLRVTQSRLVEILLEQAGTEKRRKNNELNLDKKTCRAADRQRPRAKL